MLGCPIDCFHQVLDTGLEGAIEYFHGKDLRVPRFLTDSRGDSGAMADPVDVIITVLSAVAEGDSPGDATDMRMIRINTTVDDCHANAFSGSSGKVFL